MYKSAFQKVIIILVAFLFITSISCGKKSAPFLPRKRLPFRVTFLEAEKRGNLVVLTGEIVGRKKGYSISDITGCRVYFSRYSIKNPPCESCPIYYSEFKDIKADVVRDGKFYLEIPWIKKKGIYFIKIRLLGPDGAIGGLSNQVKIVIGER